MDYFSVFFVNKGYLLHLDISSAVQNVDKLQQAIYQDIAVRVHDQVLLASGGQTLEPSRSVSEYKGVGTSSNPVYLFDRRFLRSDKDEMSCSQDLKQLQHRIDEAIEHAQRTERSSDVHQIYLDLPDRARDCKSAAQAALEMCARLAQEHSLLNNGWMALVSNMDDSVNKMRQRAQRFQRNQEKAMNLRSKATQLLQDFDTCLEQLKKITLPGVLMEAVGKHDEITLFDWISRVDPHYTLFDLVNQVREQFEKVDEWDSKRVQLELDKVYQQAKDVDFREIKGINMRLNQLDSTLTKSDLMRQNIVNLVNKVVETPSSLEPASLQTLMAQHHQNMKKVYDELRELRRISDTFHKSKAEILDNIRQRLCGWIVQAYEKLHTAHTEMVVFEEKFLALKQRIELVNQIKEAPVVFCTAVTEIIRRNSFQKEFLAWHGMHVEKCSKFSEEESQLRGDFQKKLEKHFLRVLFPGMFDMLPQFYFENLPKIDDHMPQVTSDYLRSLRKSVDGLESFLRVTTPQVFNRLAVRNPSLPSPSAPTQPMRREDSFFTPDHVNNIATMHRNFPSGTWLAGDDTMDMSPSGIPALLAKSPPSTFGPASAGHRTLTTAPSLHTLSDMADDDDQTLIPMTPMSAPISIPGQHLPDRDTTHESKASSQFSTPEDNFDKEQFPIEGVTQRSITLEQLKPITSELLQMKDVLDEIRQEVILARDQFAENTNPFVDCVQTSLENAVQVERARNEAVVADLTKQLQHLRDQHLHLEETMEKKCAECTEAMETVKKLEATNQEQAGQIQELETNAQHHEEILKEKSNEMYKKLTIEYELARDDLQSSHAKILEEKEDRIRHLQKDVDKRNSEIEKLKLSSDSDEYRQAIRIEVRQELEKEFQGKIELIAAGLEKKKVEDIARHKKDIEFDMKKTVMELQHQVKWLSEERNRLRVELQQVAGDEDGRSRSESLAVELQKLADKEAEELHVCSSYGTTERTTTATQTGLSPLVPFMFSEAPKAMLTSHHSASTPCMDVSVMPMAASAFFDQGVQHSADDLTAVTTAPEQSESSNVLTVASQTRLLMKNIDLMVSVQDIYEGSTVLVVWNERHSAFVIFSSSSYQHFVKESSIKRLGLVNTPGLRNWILARVTHVDLCVIRKPDNRYHLPVNARVYRVDIEALPQEMQHRSRASTSSEL